ncbi:MAG: DUF3795 domain-containing protein [Bacteroidota bacterium]
MGYCGYKCEFCPALRATKADDPGALAKCAEVWGRLFGIKSAPEQLRCDGCYNEMGRKADKDCRVRPCCKEKALVTCGECPSYPCALVQERFVSRDEIETRLGEPIAEEEYQAYVKPLENKGRLDTINKRYVK